MSQNVGYLRIERGSIASRSQLVVVRALLLLDKALLKVDHIFHMGGQSLRPLRKAHEHFGLLGHLIPI